MRTILLTIGKELTLTGALGTTIVGAAASYTLTARGGSAPYRITLDSWTVPGGWSVVETSPGLVWTITDSAGGTWTVTSNGDGTVDIETTEAEAGGEFSLTFRLKDAERDVRLVTRSIRVVALPLEISGALANMTVGSVYSDTLDVTGGVGDYAIVSSNLPAGVTASLAGGTESPVSIAGTPTGAGLGPGSSFSFPVSVTIQDGDGTQVVFEQAIIVSVPALTLSGSLPDGEEGTAYSFDLTRTGGIGVITIDSAIGLPDGLSATVTGSGASSTVRVSGTPDSGSSSGSPYSVAIDISDSEGNEEEYSDTMAVTPVTLPGPDDFAGLTAWLDFTDSTTLFQDTGASTPVTADGQDLQSVTNKAGGGRPYWSVITGAMGAQTYQTNEVNGKSVLRIAGSTRIFRPSSSPAASNYVADNAKTTMLVFKYSGTIPTASPVYSGSAILGGPRSGYWGLFLRTADPLGGYNYDGNVDAVANAFASDTYGVAMYRHNGTTLQIRVNNGSWQSVASGNTQAAGMAEDMRLGNEGGTQSMYIVHAVSYNVVLSDADADALRDWALNEIGL